MPLPLAKPIVFLGPSLQQGEARQVLDAEYRPPIRRGDLDDVPSGALVGIIDGVFDQTLAVSPTELRRAVSRGIRILGGSSMGALRAAEVPEVEGVGRIYRMFAEGELINDDEVAVAFTSETFQPQSEPLVNVRYAVERLVKPGTIAADVGRRIVSATRRLPYPRRTYPAILRAAGIRGPELGQLESMLASHDLQREDAITLLEHLARLPRRPASPTRSASRAARDDVDHHDAVRASPVMPAEAPVRFWEFGDEVSFEEVVRFLKLTGRFRDHARNAVGRFVLAGGDLSHDIGGGGPSTEALHAKVTQAFAIPWAWPTEEEAHVTLRDLGLGTATLAEKLAEERATQAVLMSLARESSDEFLRALRVELAISNLALKRETLRLASLRSLADRGRQPGRPLARNEIAQAHEKLREVLDTPSYAAAVAELSWWGVTRAQAEEFVEELAYARRAGRTLGRPAKVPEGRTAGCSQLRLRRSLKTPGSQRFCVPLRLALKMAMSFREVAGITRVAMITGLGDLGVPNAQAFRPGGEWSSTVGSGKSETVPGAKVGAIMEEIEKWAQEKFPNVVDVRPTITSNYRALCRARENVVDPRQLGLPYDSPFHDDLEIAWRWCDDIAQDRQILVPLAALSGQRLKNDIYYSVRAGRKVSGTNGLASGFTLEEALTHAIGETIERHSVLIAEVALQNPGAHDPAGYRFVDLETVPASTARLVARIRRAGHTVSVLDVTSEVGAPTFRAHILSDRASEAPHFGASVRNDEGSACHPNPEVSINMALLEATQTVYTNLAGSREDLTLRARSLGRHERSRTKSRAGHALPRAVDQNTKAFGSITGFVSRDARADVRWLANRLRDIGCPNVIVIDYTVRECPRARVVRALVPGLEAYTNPFSTGLWARAALIRDLLPSR